MTEPSFPPPGYQRVRIGPHDVVAWEPVLPAVEAALEQVDSLYAWAAGRGRPSGAGRGPVYRVRLGAGEAAVRHALRGGWMRPLRDRYLGRRPRPFSELATSEALRATGVPTPRILAAVATPALPGYRGDIAVEWLEPGHDLEALLRPGAYARAHREAALGATGRAVGLGHRAGLDHPDLQHRNLFVRPLPDHRWEGWLLDLDRARIVAGADGHRSRNLERLERSLAKAERSGRLAWTGADRAAFLAGYDAGLRGE